MAKEAASGEANACIDSVQGVVMITQQHYTRSR